MCSCLQTVAIHKEKVARREIGVLTTNKTTSRLQNVKNPGIIFPTDPERPVKYVRQAVDFTALDDIGHGVKQQQSRRQSADPRRSVNAPVGAAPTGRPPEPPSHYRSSQGMTGSLSRQSSNISNYAYVFCCGI